MKLWPRRSKDNKAKPTRARLLRDRAIDTVFDVGANQGQFGQLLRREGYRGPIISFEPLRSAFTVLKERCAADRDWNCHNLALGNADTEARINISANSHSSSLLPVAERAVAIEPSIAYVGSEPVTVRRLDTLMPTITQAGHAFLKIDTQGFELNVLEGAAGMIEQIDLVQVEVAWVPSYLGQPSVSDLILWLDGHGFGVLSIDPGWTDIKTGFVLEADLLFGRR